MQVQVGVLAASTFGGFLVRNEIGAKLQAQLQLNPSHNGWKIKLKPLQGQLILAREESRSFFVSFHNQTGQEIRLPDVFRANAPIEPCLHDKKMLGKWLLRWTGLVCCATVEREGERFQWQRPNFLFNQQTRTQLSCTSNEPKDRSWTIEWHRKSNQLYFKYDYPESTLPRMIEFKVRHKSDSNQSIVVVVGQMADTSMRFDILYQNPIDSNQRKWNLNFQWNQLQIESIYTDQFRRHLNKSEYRPEFKVFASSTSKPTSDLDQLLPSISNASNAIIDWSGSFGIDRDRKTVLSAYMMDRLENSKIWRSFVSIDKSIGRKVTIELQSWKRPLPIGHLTLEFDAQRKHTSLDVQIAYGRNHSRHAKFMIKVHDLSMNQLKRLGGFVQVQSTDCLRCNVLLTASLMHRPGSYVEHELNFHWPYSIELRNHSVTLTTPHRHRYGIRHVGQYLPTSTVDPNHFHLLHRLTLRFGQWTKNGQFAVLWLPGQLPHIRFLVEFGDELQLQAGRKNVLSSNHSSMDTISASTRNSVDDLLRAANESMQSGNILLLGEYHQSSVKPQRNSIVALLQLQSVAFVRFVDQLREWPINFYDGQMSLYWAPDQSRFARLQYTLHSQQNYGRTEHELHSQLFSSMWAGRLKHTAKLQMHRNQLQLQSTALISLQPIWSVSFNALRGNSSGHRVRSDQVQLNVDSGLGKIRLDTSLAPIKQTIRLHMISGRIEHRSDVSFDWIDRDWQTSMKTTFQQESLLSWHSRLAPGREHAIRFNCSRGFATLQVLQQPILSGKVQLNWPSKNFRHYTAWTAPENELLLSSETRRAENVLLAMQVNSGRKGTASVEWSGQLIRAHWNEIKARTHYEWTGSYVKDGQVWHQGQAQLAATQLQSNFTSITLNGSRWMNVSTVLNAQDISWVSIELPESKHRFSANPFVVEPFFELQRYRHRLQDRLHLKYVIGRDQERYFSAIRDWPTIDRQQKQLFQIGWAGRVQQFHVQHLNQWIRVEANRKMKGFDVQLRLWNERVMRQEIMLQRNETFLSGKFCTWIGERPIIKANLNHETNRKGQASIGSRWMNGTTFYELVQGQVVNGSCSIQTMHITHQTNFTQTSELMSLHTLTTSGDLPIALVRVDVDYHNESVFQAEIPMAKIHGRISPKGARRQLWFELQRLLGQQQLGRLVFNVKSADGMASVRSEWSPQTSNTTKLLLFALLDPVKTSRLIFNAGSIHSSLLFHLPNATHEGVGLLKAEHVIQEWSHEMHLRLPTFRQWHFKGHCKQGPVTLIHLNRLSLVLSDRWRPNVLLEAEISGQITAPSIRPIIGSNLTMNLNLTNDPQFTYTGRFLGNHFQVDALISDQYKSIVSGRLFDNRLNASFDWFVQPKLGNVQIDWNRFRHQTHFKVHGNHTLNINSNTIDANDRQLLDLVGLLSVSNSSLIHVNSPMFRLDSALHPYQEIKNFTLAYDNFSMNQTHRSIVEFAFQRFLHIHSLGERQQQKWYELRLNGSRREGGWLHYERDCCTRLNANYTITKDRRDLIARFDKDQVQRRLTAAIFREQSDEQENTKSKHSLFNMFSNRFAKPNVAESNGSERKLMPKLGGNKFGAKKLTTTDGPNAANLMYVVERDGEVETKIQLWAPAFKASGGQLESRVYSGTIDFNAIERRLAMHLRNQESGHDERWIAFYESWLACHFEVTRTAKDAIIYSYVWLLSPDRQRLLMIKSPRHLEIDASVMGNQSHGPSGRFVYENSVEKHRLRSEVNVNDLTSGHLQSETRWRDQLWYDLDLLVNTNPALPSTPKASYAARLRLLAPIWRFEHWSEVKLGQQFVLNSDTKRNEKRVFWLQSTLHRHQIQWFDLDGDIETNDLLDVQVHLKSKNETIHFSKIKFDGLKLIARSSHRPAGRSLYDLDLSGSGIEVSHLKVNTSRHDLSLEGAWLEWHKLAHVQYRSPTRYLAQHVELISIEDSGTLTKTIQGRLYSDWLDDRYVNGSLSIANQAVNAHVQLHPLLEQWLFGQAQLAVIRSDRHNLLQILFIKNNQTLETEAAALFDEEGGRPRSVKVRLNSTQESIPAFELQSQRNTTNDCVTINGSFRLNTIQCKLNGELNPSHVPVEIMLQQHENSDLKRLLHVKHRSTDKHLDTLAILRLTNQQYGFSVENNSNQTIDDGSHPIQIDVHVRNHTSRLIWTKTSHSASGQLYPNAADPNDVYLIQVKSNGSSELNLLNASYEIDHPKLLRTQSIDLRLSDYRRQGNLTFDLLPNENQKLQIEYQIINEFGMYAGRVWIRDHLIQKFDVETQLSIVRHNPLAGSSFRWRWLTSSGERLHGRYQVQWRGPEFLIVDDPTNRIELSGSIDTIDLGHNASAWLEPSGDRSLLRKPITLDQSQVRVHQMRVNERAIQLRSGRVKSMVHCWIVALFDRHSPNVQQRLCFDQSLAEDVARLQAEQWMAGLLQSKSTVTWSLTDSGLQVLARYDLNQWTHVWVEYFFG